MIKRYYKMRADAPGIFRNRYTPRDQLTSFKFNLCTVLPDKDSEGRTLFLCRAGAWEPSKLSKEDFFMSVLLMMELSIRDVQTLIKGMNTLPSTRIRGYLGKDSLPLDQTKLDWGCTGRSKRKLAKVKRVFRHRGHNRYGRTLLDAHSEFHASGSQPDRLDDSRLLPLPYQSYPHREPAENLLHHMEHRPVRSRLPECETSIKTAWKRLHRLLEGEKHSLKKLTYAFPLQSIPELEDCEQNAPPRT